MSKNNSFITYKHLIRFLTCQPYFVWNNEKINFDTEIVEDLSQNEFSLWEFDIDDVPLEYAEVMKSAYGKIDYYFEKQILHEAKMLDKKLIIINEKNSQVAFNKTIEAINNIDIDWIVNPVFICDELIAKPKLFRKEVMQISSLIHSTKSKLKYYIQAYFEINVINKTLKENKIFKNVEAYSFFTYDNKSTYLEVPDLKFIESQYCNSSKNAPSKNKVSSIEESEKLTIIEKISSGIIKETKNEIVGFLNEFDWYIEQIRKAKNIDSISQINWNDLTQWGCNNSFLDIYPFEKVNINKISGNILSKKDLLEILDDPLLLNSKKQNKKSLELLLDKKDVIDIETTTKSISKIKNKKCVWFDFEGFSLPFVFLKHTKPYQQIIFQVSVIKTDNDNILKKENIVLDPQNLKTNDFKKIVDSIYDLQTEQYIVYNKSYEHSRLNEIKDRIFKYELNNDEFNEYSNKIDEIISKTYDLLDLFNVTSSKTKIPPIFLQKLNGFSSIKKIEDLITKNNIKLPIMIKPYKSLKVQNGLMAMNKGIQRYLRNIGDLEWKEISKNLAEYCENDVLAMIMVYHYILYIIFS